MMAILVLSALQALLHGGVDPAPLARTLGGDSSAVLKEAKRAQERFERLHRSALPTRRDVWARRCEERLGRFVLSQSEDADSIVPAEPERIGRARDTLLAQLSRAQASIPSDGWVVGQRVRYLIDARRPRDAIEVARACRADPAWCAALAGLAYHVAGDFAAADSTFAVALARLPDAERCRWNDLSFLLRDKLAARYGKLGCAERASFEERFWWLARPLFTLQANDLRTEHLARVVMTRIQEDARLVYNLRWGSDLEEVMIRYGWATAWSQNPASSFAAEPVISEHMRSPTFDFVPAAMAMDDPGRAPADAWALSIDCPRASYSPAYANSYVVPDNQAAFFRRGDSAFVVAAYDVRDDTIMAPLTLEASLVLAVDERSAPIVETKERAFAHDVLTAKGPWMPQLVSLEVVAREQRRVARSRFGLAPRGGLDAGIAVSDLLLFDPPDTLPATLAEVLPFVRGSTRVREGENLGIFWEIYGLDQTEERLSVSLTVTPRGPGLLRRAGESLGLLPPATPVVYHWLETIRGRGSITPRSIAVDLTRLSRGRHLIELLVGPEGRAPLVVRREIEVVKNNE
jgi:hypothetical protein